MNKGGGSLFYFRKLWSLIYLVLGTFYLTCEYVLVKIIEYIANFLSASGKVHFATKVYHFVTRVHHFVTLLLYIVTILSVLLIVWLLVDIFSGQLKLDLKSAQITRLLRRQVSSESLQVVASEEKSANCWIRKGRIIQRDSKLMFIIPCFGSSAVAAIIQKRCEDYLLKWLDNNFPRTKWTPLATKTSGLGTWLIVKEK